MAARHVALARSHLSADVCVLPTGSSLDAFSLRGLTRQAFAVALRGDSLSLVLEPLALVCNVLAVVSRPFALIGDAIAVIGMPFALRQLRLAQVKRALALGSR